MLQASDGWLEGWKKRFNVSFKIIYTALSEIFLRNFLIQTYQTQSYQITYIKSFRIWNFNSTAVTFDLKKVSKSLWKLSWFPFWEKIYSSCLIILHHLVKFACILFSQNIVEASKNCFFLCIQIFQCSWCPARKSWRGRDYYDLLCINECFFN